MTRHLLRALCPRRHSRLAVEIDVLIDGSPVLAVPLSMLSAGAPTAEKEALRRFISFIEAFHREEGVL